MSFIDDIIAGGIDPLQDTDRDMDIAFRSVRMGARVVDRDPDGGYVLDRQSIGDQMGWVLWQQIPGARPCPMWMHATPSRVVNAADSGGTGTAADFFGVIPVGFNFDYDARFGIKTPSTGRISSGARRRIWNRSPRGQVGIILSTTDEYNPTELFMPTDPRMIAVNVAGSPDMGSIVSDLRETNDYDGERYARLQTMMRVVPLGESNGIMGFVPDPESVGGGKLGAIAWNLALTGREHSLGRGLIIDNRSAAMPPPPSRTPPPVETPSNQGPPPPPPPPPGGP